MAVVFEWNVTNSHKYESSYFIMFMLSIIVNSNYYITASMRYIIVMYYFRLLLRYLLYFIYTFVAMHSW